MVHSEQTNEVDGIDQTHEPKVSHWHHGVRLVAGASDRQAFMRRKIIFIHKLDFYLRRQSLSTS